MQVARVAFLTSLSIALAAASLAAQAPRGPRLYDVTTVVTLKGTVEEVMQVSGPGRMGGGAGGVQLKLKTDKETVVVHLGPRFYLEEQNFKLAKGDAVEVIGSRVKLEGEEIVVAREVVKDKTRLKLRTEDGMPLWSPGRRPPPPQR